MEATEGQSIEGSTRALLSTAAGAIDVSEFDGGGGSRDFSRAAAKLEMSSRKEREREDRWSVGSVASRQ